MIWLQKEKKGNYVSATIDLTACKIHGELKYSNKTSAYLGDKYSNNVGCVALSTQSCSPPVNNDLRGFNA